MKMGKGGGSFSRDSLSNRVFPSDTAIGRIYEACKASGYVLMVTADHGNAEKMIAPDGSKHTAHTCFPGA